MKVPLRVDFAGGWLDVPSLPNGFIVNCAISPLVSLDDWPYKVGSGLGGSAAWRILRGLDGVEEELKSGVGWQDPAIIKETGLCVWKSGKFPTLVHKTDGSMMRGLMAVSYHGGTHNTPSLVSAKRPYTLIQSAGKIAKKGVELGRLDLLTLAVNRSYRAQLIEGMDPVDEVVGSVAKKYLGSGWGGYVLYLFSCTSDRDNSGLTPVEPYYA